MNSIRLSLIITQSFTCKGKSGFLDTWMTTRDIYDCQIVEITTPGVPPCGPDLASDAR